MSAEVHFPQTAGEATSLIAERAAVPMAGATWIMRGPLRGEAPAPAYVALARIAELHELSLGVGALVIGAGVTHHALATALRDRPALRGLHAAAATSANPAVRRMATVGGALGATGFESSDLLPALLALDAEVELMDAPGTRRTLSLEEFLRHGADRGRVLVTAVRVGALPRASAHRRLCLRRAGDYPVAIVATARAASGDVRIAVGSVGSVARRWHGLERELGQGPVDVAAARGAAERHTDELEPRDGIEAPAWYRAHVVTGLAAAALAEVG